MLRYLIMYLYKKKNGKKFDLKIACYSGLPYSGWTYQSETTLNCLNSLLRISKQAHLAYLAGSAGRGHFFYQDDKIADYLQNRCR